LSYQYLILFHKIKTKERLKFPVKAQNLELESVGKAQVSASSTHFSFKLQLGFLPRLLIISTIVFIVADTVVWAGIRKLAFFTLNDHFFASDLAGLGRWAALGYKFYLVEARPIFACYKKPVVLLVIGDAVEDGVRV